MIRQKLRLSQSPPHSPVSPEDSIVRARSTSSEYPSNGHASPRVVSPASTVFVNGLAISDLRQFGRGNDRLSFLCSSPSSYSRGVAGEMKDSGIMGEATTASNECRDTWPQSPLKSIFNPFELIESAEILPSDSLSQKRGAQASEAESIACASINERVNGNKTPKVCIQGFTGRYDGTVDFRRRMSSEAATSALSLALEATNLSRRGSKRKASQFSLRSLTRPFAKRPRLGFRRWAHHVLRRGSRRLSQAYRRWRRQNERERREFEA